MLIKTQVKRRTESLNQYILELKEKVFDRRYKEAKILLTHRKQSINNSYMAPYDPNVYLLDSLKAKHQKLVRERELVEHQILKKLEEINKIKLKRGYQREAASNKNERQQIFQFNPKMEIEEVGVYTSRFPLKLEDVDKIDYEMAKLQTNFQMLRIAIEDSFIALSFRQVLSIQTDEVNILLCWKPDKPDSKNYIIFRFEKQEDRKYWTRCFQFAKLISESELKEKLFYKEENNYLINVKGEQDAKAPQENAPIQKPINKLTNLNINSNKSSALDRLRRKSQYYPTLPTPNNLSLINRSKFRKISEDLSMKQPLNKTSYLYDRKMQNEKSQKSFEDEVSQVNSSNEKKQESSKQKQMWKNQFKKPEPLSKIQKLKEEREKLMESKINQNNNTQSNRQIFFNQSSIHWIQEQNQEMNSRSSQPSKNMIGKKNILDMLNKDTGQNAEKSQHISEAPAEIEQSPLLPYSMRDKARQKGLGNSGFEVRIKEVQMTKPQRQLKLKDIEQIKSQRSGRSQQSRKVEGQQKSTNAKGKKAQVYTAEEKENSFDNEMEGEQQEEENKQNQIDSINEQSGDEDSQYAQKQAEEVKQVEDKSQDIASQNENSETESRKYGLDDLKSGIILLKCSPNTWNPHIKKVHLSNNDSQLCYKDEKGQNLKKIDLSDIEKIEYNTSVVTAGILKHIKNYKKERCMVIKYQQENKPKMLQFYLPPDKKLEDLQNFYQKLNTYVQFKNNAHSSPMRIF